MDSGILEPILRFFREGGFWMFPVLFAGVVAVLCGLLHAIIARGVTLGFALAPLAIVLVFGGLGTFRGRQGIDAALVYAPRTMQDALRAEGNQEAWRPTELAGLLAAVALVPTAVGELRRRRRPS